MDHVRVREGYRTWHGASHLDDARQAPVNYTHFDGYKQGPTTDSPFAPGERIPGLNVGGWYDAGDFDLRTQTQTRVIMDLAMAKEDFGVVRTIRRWTKRHAWCKCGNRTGFRISCSKCNMECCYCWPSITRSATRFRASSNRLWTNTPTWVMLLRKLMVKSMWSAWERLKATACIQDWPMIVGHSPRIRPRSATTRLGTRCGEPRVARV